VTSVGIATGGLTTLSKDAACACTPTPCQGQGTYSDCHRQCSSVALL